MQFRFMSLKVLGSLAGLALAACGGGSEKPAKSADEVQIEQQPDDGLSGVSMSSEIGGLNQEDVDRVFAKASSDLSTCLDRGAERVEFLGGDVKFLVKIGQDGRVQNAHLEESTIGDRETETCMLNALKKRTWPKPVGGETGIAQKPYSFDMPNDVRPPTDWTADNIEEALHDLSDELGKCEAGSSSFTVTMYVDTDGAVMAAGIAYADDAADSAADCVVSTIREAKFPSPGSWPAKVSFSL